LRRLPAHHVRGAEFVEINRSPTREELRAAVAAAAGLTRLDKRWL